MVMLGNKLGAQLQPGAMVFINGELGAGKTTFARGVLQSFGHDDLVTSPTFTLVEAYRLKNTIVYHFDLYRLESTDELEALGIRDMLDGNSICLFEWPERWRGWLPPPDYLVDIAFAANGRTVKVQPACAPLDYS